MEYKDYYKTLGVSRSASADEIRSAYRKLAMKYHPDRNPGDKQAEDHFKEINEAYQVLSDSQKRARYDQLGSAYSSWQSSGRPGGGFDWSQWSNANGQQQVNLDEIFGAGGFSDFFSSIFSGVGGAQSRGGAAGPYRSPEAEYPTTISLEEAYQGTTRSLDSAGQRKQIRIPPGVREGSRIRFAGGGVGGSDVYLRISISPDPNLERKGDDLYMPVSVDVFTVLLGGEVEVNTLGGRIRVNIPAGTQPDQLIRLTGRGMPLLKSPETKGDLYLRVRVQIPKNLTARQKELLLSAKKETA